MAQQSMARGWASGGTVFAATIMLILGIYQAILGIAAIVNDKLFVVSSGYVYRIDTTAWGWIHLGLGVLAAITGVFLFSGATWARWVGIAFAVLSATANFFFLPYYPIWSLLIIALDIFVIWALATVRIADVVDEGPGAAAYAGAGPRDAEAQRQGERWPATNQPGGRHWATDEPTTPAPGAAQPAPGAAQPPPAAPAGTSPAAGSATPGEAIPPTTPQ